MAGSLSVQLYTVRRDLARDPAGTASRLASIGFEAVEGFALVELADTLTAALRASGLPMPSAHASLVGADLDAAFAAARRLGVATLIEPWVDPARWTTREDVETLAAGLSAIATRAADEGLEIGYHNHAHELEHRIGGTSALEVFADALDPAVVLEVDTFWAEEGGEDAPALLGRLGERVRLLHVKDGRRGGGTAAQGAVGSGDLPVAAILAAAPQARPVVELDEYAGDVFEALAESRRFLVGLGA